MAITFDDSEFKDIVEDSNNEEIKTLFVEFMQQLKKSDKENLLVSAVNENSQRVTNLANAMSRIKFEADHSGVIESLNKIFETVNESLTEVRKTNDNLLRAVHELININSADRVFKPTYGVLHKLESIIVSIKK
jgi:predicted P-loop ATPase/GTPase